LPLSTIVAFLEGIGISARPTELPDDTFLPGLTMSEGAVLYDPDRLLYPGDLLHEAAHIALTPAVERAGLSAATTFTLGDDLAAIAWSWAALTHLRLEPAIVFHDGGYQGGARAFIDNFSNRRFVGVPMLQWLALTDEPTFPEMIKWLRD
jgi:hypothetical protein